MRKNLSKLEMMASEVLVSQVLEEIKHSIFLINESLGFDKYDASSFSDFSVSAALDLCDVRVVDELPPISQMSEECLFVVPCCETQNNGSRGSLGPLTQQSSGITNYIVVTVPQTASNPGESVYTPNGTGGNSVIGMGVSNHWNYDEGESTSEGSFLSDWESDLRDESDMEQFQREEIASQSNFCSDFDEDRGGDLSLVVDEAETIGGSYQANRMSCGIIGGTAPQTNEGYSRDKLSSLRTNIGLAYDDGLTKEQDGAETEPSKDYISETRMLKRRVASDIRDEEREYKTIRRDPQLPVCRNSASNKILY